MLLRPPCLTVSATLCPYPTLFRSRYLFGGQRAWLASHNKKLPVAIRYGAMLEVPGLVETLDLMLPHLDFLSVGTNDLTQFLFAADRAHPRLAERYDWLSPIVMRYLSRVVRTVSGSKVALGVCGELGGRPPEAMRSEAGRVGKECGSAG